VGLRVDVEVTGEPAGLPLGLELAAYRIVQEALTNTRRHARATRACVRLDHTADRLRIEVTDDGSGPGDSGSADGGSSDGGSSGHGLIGMRERAALYGGTVSTGTAPGGGFRVLAVLPRDGVPAA
jgi:signal transduction histidine kinase